MPGYDRGKFVGNSGIDLDEFTCGICYGIFIKPLVTDCCQQAFCSDCINEWLVNHNTCPNDRKTLTKEGLRAMPRAFINLLENLTIKCKYESEGCPETIKLSQLDRHLNDCPLKPNTICKVCGIMREIASKHNCIESLLKQQKTVLDEKVQEMETKIQLIVEDYESKVSEIKQTFAKIQNNFEKEIDEIKSKRIREFEDLTEDIENWSKQITEIKWSQKRGADKLVDGKVPLLVNNYIIKRRSRKIPEYLFQFIVEKCKEAILLKSDVNEISRYLYKQMKEKTKDNLIYGKHKWFIVVNSGGEKSWFMRFDQANQVWIQFQHLDIVLTYYKNEL